MKYLLSLLLFASPILHGKENIYLKICSNSSAESMVAFLNNFISKSDQISKASGNCIDIFTSANKEDLFVKAAKIKFGAIEVSSTTQVDKKQCRLSLITTKSDTTKNNIQKIEMHARSPYMNIQTQSNKGDESTHQQIVMQSGESATALINFHTLKLKCRLVDDGAQVDINSTDINFSYSSQIFLRKGQAQSLGNFSRNNKTIDKDLGIGGINLNNGQKNESVTVQIRLD